MEGRDFGATNYRAGDEGIRQGQGGRGGRVEEYHPAIEAGISRGARQDRRVELVAVLDGKGDLIESPEGGEVGLCNGCQ